MEGDDRHDEQEDYAFQPESLRLVRLVDEQCAAAKPDGDVCEAVGAREGVVEVLFHSGIY